MAASNRKSKTKTASKSASVVNRPPPPSLKALSSSSLRKPTLPKTAASKQTKVLEMLRAHAGTTIAAVMKATDWQQNSVRGFFAGTERKKLKLNLTSGKINGQRVYRIAKTVTTK
jgi:hypothetical protein